MELRQLIYFEAVVRFGGFTRAAEKLHIAQPAVSAQIRRLEAELGTTLLRRTTRHVSLTHAGELFLDRVRRILGELDGARADLDELADVVRGEVRIGATQVLGSLDLPAAMAAFHRRYPGVRLSLRTGLIAGLLTALGAGDIDMVIGPVHADLQRRYLGHPLVEEALVLVTAPDHPRAGAGIHTLAAVGDEPFVCLPKGSGLQAILTGAAAAEGFVPRIVYETHSPASIRELVAAGLGVALLASSAAGGPGAPIAVHRLNRAPPHPPIGLIRRRAPALTPAARAFHDEVSASHSGALRG